MIWQQKSAAESSILMPLFAFFAQLQKTQDIIKFDEILLFSFNFVNKKFQIPLNPFQNF